MLGSTHKGTSGTGRAERNWRAPTSIREQPEYCWLLKSVDTHTSSCCAGRASIDQQCLRERACRRSQRPHDEVHGNTLTCDTGRERSSSGWSEAMSGAIAALRRAAQGRLYIPTSRRSTAQPAARRAGFARARSEFGPGSPLGKRRAWGTAGFDFCAAYRPARARGVQVGHRRGPKWKACQTAGPAAPTFHRGGNRL